MGIRNVKLRTAEPPTPPQLPSEHQQDSEPEGSSESEPYQNLRHLPLLGLVFHQAADEGSTPKDGEDKQEDHNQKGELPLHC